MLVKHHHRVPHDSTLPFPLALGDANPLILDVLLPLAADSSPSIRQACSAASSLAPFTYWPSYQNSAGAVGPKRRTPLVRTRVNAK